MCDGYKRMERVELQMQCYYLAYQLMPHTSKFLYYELMKPFIGEEEYNRLIADDEQAKIDKARQEKEKYLKMFNLDKKGGADE